MIFDKHFRFHLKNIFHWAITKIVMNLSVLWVLLPQMTILYVLKSATPGTFGFVHDYLCIMKLQQSW